MRMTSAGLRRADGREAVRWAPRPFDQRHLSLACSSASRQSLGGAMEMMSMGAMALLPA